MKPLSIIIFVLALWLLAGTLEGSVGMMSDVTPIPYGTYQEENQTTGDPYIQFFSDYDFQGNTMNLPLNFTGCLSLNDGEYSEWEGIPFSLKVTNNSCVILYKERYCMGPSQWIISMPYEISDLRSHDLRGDIRSLRVCNIKDDIVESVLKILSGNSKYTLFVYCIIPFACIGVLTSTVLALNFLHTKKQQSFRKHLSESEINKFVNGFKLNHKSRKKADVWFGRGQTKSSIMSMKDQAQSMPYNYQLEIPIHNIKYDDSSPIGVGRFGNVFKGNFVTPEGTEDTVVVKTPELHSSQQPLRALLEEIKIRMYLGDHPHVVALIGCSTANLREGKLLIVLEYCQYGTLQSYLQENRPNFVNLVHKGQLHSDDGVSNSKLEEKLEKPEERYVAMCALKSDVFNIHKLINWSIEIAEAMGFLAAKNITNGKLCTRNILLGPMKQAKICNFGCPPEHNRSRRTIMKSKETLLWRWYSLESLKNMDFTSESDVWSYGILLWEIFTLGEQPYPGVSNLTNDFIRNLYQGVRLTIPQYATSDIYNIMSSCWDENPKLRPSFQHLKFILQEAVVEEIVPCKNKQEIVASS